MNSGKISANNSLEQDYDVIVVGQGLAGSLVTFFLKQQNKNVLVIDQGGLRSSSHIAAGIIHPVTGRRIVKSWRADELIAFATDTYQLIGEKFSSTFYFSKDILEIYPSIKHRNDWLNRSEESGMKNFIKKEIPPDSIPSVIMPYGGMVVSKAGYLDIQRMLSSFRSLYSQEGLQVDFFDYKDLIISKEKIKWKTYTATDIIFCEGAAGTLNPFFDFLPYVPSKGEILTILAPGISDEFILNKSVYLLPLGDHVFRAGATNEWTDLNSNPTAAGRDKLEKLIRTVIRSPYEILDHQAAVRPTVKDRRPFLGSHPLHPHLHIFNGLGTKGVMLAPYFAKQAANMICGNHQPDPEVNINRFL